MRRLLAQGLTGRIRWGCSFAGYEYTNSGTVRVDLGDGSSAQADLLVGADGTFSRVARQLTGRATATYAGVSAIAGRTPLSGDYGVEAPPDLAKGPAFVIGPDGVGAFLSAHSLEPEDRLAVLDGSAPVAADLEESYLVWSIAAPGPEPETRPDNGTAQDAALRSIASWSPSLRSLVEASDPTSVTRFAFYRDTGLTPHPARKVALLGDAIHPMPPTGGAGASTAIRDAECLNRHVLDDPNTLPLSIYEYQREMLAYARETSSESLLPLRIQRRTSGNLPRLLLTRLALPAAQAAMNTRMLLRGD